MSLITTDELIAKLIEASGDNRIIIAIAGPPASGKTTYSHVICRQLNELERGICAVLSADGFHYDNIYLKQKGWRERKGAPHTFDVDGLFHILKRLTLNSEQQIAIPVFDRKLEISRGAATVISGAAKIIIIEGNYLLLKEPPWAKLKEHFDFSIMLQVSEETLTERLEKRWRDFGFSDKQIQLKLDANDLINVKAVCEESTLADYIIDNENEFDK